ncbi:DUF3806 domain-containing protein [Ideonella azotifigens]|uniref:DUF3806 domain-containing protein n=1 Tax=Ideonella azotifigens TaxID=513160 RepID=A0ABN1K761_9BURK|nr:DUF3806 domain-containing protein [Ideonella azotifigens]MCD2342209.1 DUF3806 domain-containing protein [Ideonella azotifigens]
MSIVTDILDALRRFGKPTQRSALARQNAQLEGKTLLAQKRQSIPSPDGPVEAFIATIEPSPETMVALSDAETAPILENASFAGAFINVFLGTSSPGWTLQNLDQAFEAWLSGKDKHGYSSDAVVEILGAAFGQYCIEHLHMQWIKLTDQYGTTLAVNGIDRQFRGFPYHTISKRIESGEFGFFSPVYAALAHQASSATLRTYT